MVLHGEHRCPYARTHLGVVGDGGLGWEGDVRGAEHGVLVQHLLLALPLPEGPAAEEHLSTGGWGGPVSGVSYHDSMMRGIMGRLA